MRGRRTKGTFEKVPLNPQNFYYKRKKRARKACKISGKIEFSHHGFVMAFCMQKEKPRARRGEDYDSFCLVTINAFTRSQSCSNSEFTLSVSKSFPCKSLNMLLGYTQ